MPKQKSHSREWLNYSINYLCLPDNDSLLCRKEHLTVGDAECLIEVIDIAKSSVHTILAERVHIGLGQTDSLLITDILSPDSSI